MRDLFDVIVVGAGPGGSSAAAAALRCGLSVAQVDRHPFPRVKPCAGGLTVKSVRALRLPLGRQCVGEFRNVELNAWGRRVDRLGHVSATVLRMVDRPRFDAWLVARNRESPDFRFFADERVVGVVHDGTFEVRTERRTLRGRHLVGADGANGVVGRALGLRRPPGQAVAAEVIVRRDQATLDEESLPSFDFGAIDSGYGWVFPKDDHWNVGLYTHGKPKRLRRQLADYVVRKGFRLRVDVMGTFAAHPFPFGGHRLQAPEVPAYLVGDAGGYGDPIMGEGIYHALESGRIAGETIADCEAGRATPADYPRRLRRTVLRDTRATFHVARIFYHRLDPSLRILGTPWVWRPLLQGYSEGATFAEVLNSAPLLFGKSLAGRTLEHQRLAWEDGRASESEGAEEERMVGGAAAGDLRRTPRGTP